MTKQTHIVDGVAYCGTLVVAPPFVGMSDATLGACVVNPGTTPPGRKTSMLVSWRYDLSDRTPTDVTQFANVFKVSKQSDPMPFPGANMFACLQSWSAGSYVALEFIAPADTGKIGMFTHGETLPGPNIDMALNQNIGDFTTNVASNLGPGQVAFRWKQPSAVANGVLLVPGQRYYLNVRMHDPHATASVITLQSNHT